MASEQRGWTRFSLDINKILVVTVDPVCSSMILEGIGGWVLLSASLVSGDDERSLVLLTFAH